MIYFCVRSSGCLELGSKSLEYICWQPCAPLEEPLTGVGHSGVTWCHRTIFTDLGCHGYRLVVDGAIRTLLDRLKFKTNGTNALNIWVKWFSMATDGLVCRVISFIGSRWPMVEIIPKCVWVETGYAKWYGSIVQML